MLRSTCFLAAPLLLSSISFSQDVEAPRLLPSSAQIKQGGTFHVSTKTWTRDPSPTAGLGPDRLYDNSCNSAVFLILDSGESLVDSGLLPDPGASVPGTLSSYVINGFEVAYCTSEAAPIDLQVNHFDAYQAGQDATLHTPVSEVLVSGAPGSLSAGSISCWIVTVDLSPGSFTLQAGSTPAETFGWEFVHLTPAISGPAGPLLAGDPQAGICPMGDGTVFQNPAGSGTGLGTVDLLTLYQNAPTTAPGASLVGSLSGSYPLGAYLSLFHRLHGESMLPGPGTLFCDGGPAAPVSCPCGNSNDGSAGDPAGCRNTNNPTGGMLRASGKPFAASPDQLVLLASNVAPGTFGLFYQGDNQVNNGAGVTFGDGLRCVSGSIVRVQVLVADPNGNAATTVDIAAVGGVSPGQTKSYQYWYRSSPISLCGHGFNLTNGITIF